MTGYRQASLAVLITTTLASQVWAISPTPDELGYTCRWVAEHFQQAKRTEIPALKPAEPVKPGLAVLANYGTVQRNGRDGHPLRIAGKMSTRGLYCHAVSRILVRLPGEGRSFTSIVGIDTNGDYSGGSVEFMVHVGDKRVFCSPVMHRGEPAVPLAVNLAGAKEFTISVGDARDNINSDQASWIDAKVTLADGREIWLGDLPLVQGAVPWRQAVVPPFSFVYDDLPSDDLLGNWKFKECVEQLPLRKTRQTQTYTDPKTGLEVRCVIVEYGDYPTVEWTVYFKNTGSRDTPILEDIQTLDTQFHRNAGEFRLHHFIGSLCAPNDYQPLEAALTPNATKRITTQGGRPTNSDLPYFNIEKGVGGVIAVVSWAGQWAAEFSCDAGNALRVRGGQEVTHFRLHPGEEVRSPMAVLQFYRGDWIRGQNIWRSWMFDHNLPMPCGKRLAPMISACNGNHYPGIITNAAEELHFLRRYLEEKIRPDYWWEDAGWYPCEPVGWPKTGTWEVEKKRWPKGIREVSDWCRSQGIKTIVWFEPERVHAGTWIAENRPRWVYGGKDGGLLKLGDPGCRKWLVNHIDTLLTQEGIDLYRQDFNIDPLAYWRGNDAEDRQGIAEIRHVEGYFAYWDELLRRRPGMLIDSCASGGRRNDLETLRRAVPLLRSDYTFEPVGEQNHTYGLSFWIPFNGTGFITVDKYLIRSQMSPEFTIGVDTRRKDLDYNLLRELVREWRQVSPNYFGDYYPLTKYAAANTIWMAWQFDRPDMGTGFLQAFRRGECPEESICLKLRGLEPKTSYALTDFDTKVTWQASGKALLEQGLLLRSATRPAAIVIGYKKGRS